MARKSYDLPHSQPQCIDLSQHGTDDLQLSRENFFRARLTAPVCAASTRLCVRSENRVGGISSVATSLPLASRKQPSHDHVGRQAKGCRQDHGREYPADHFCVQLFCVSGVCSCVPFTNERSLTRRKSSARSCRAMHECAGRLSESSARPCGRSRLLKNSQLGSDARFERPAMSFQVNAILRRNHCSPSSGRSRRLLNDRSAA